MDREVRVMRQLAGHVGVVRLLHHLETPGFVYVAMERCGGGSLLDHVRAARRLGEGEAAGVLQQLLHALQFCHRKDVSV